jgi:FkbM family methyltransferase
MTGWRIQLMVLRRIVEEPLNRRRKMRAVFRYFFWQIIKRPGFIINYTFFENCKIRVRHRFHNSTACAYVGLPEFNCKAFLLHFLRSGDLMADAGANIGVYSIVAAKVCGARVLAFEPEPAAFAELEANITLNQIGDLVQPFAVALGGEPEQMRITTTHGVMNHLVELDDANDNSLPVMVHPLDDYCEKDVPLLIKIDVEGYESLVIWGALITLTNPKVNVIILERMGLGQRYGFDEDILHENILKLGFKCFEYLPFTKILRPIEKTETGNYFYVRDEDFVRNRLESARKYSCRGREF